MLVCDRPGKWPWSERPRPSPGPGEVLVRIRRAGVCGTDLHIYEGSHPFLEYPRVIGHELSGEVAETGPGCEIAVGQKVYVIPYLPVASASPAGAARPIAASASAVLGRAHRRRDGRLRLRAGSQCRRAADGITLDQAAMVEFLAIGAHAVRRASPRKGDRILVVGAGRSASAA